MRLVNLTPHEVTVYKDGEPYAVFPPSGEVARVTESRSAAPDLCVDMAADTGYARLLWEVPVAELNIGARDVTGLPDQGAIRMDGRRIWEILPVGYIVSRLVAEAVAGGRDDLFCPGPEIRDEAGRIIGCDGLFSVFGHGLVSARSPRLTA